MSGRSPLRGSGHSPKGGAASASPAKPSVPNADSGDMPGYYGILNEARQFWSHTVHSSKREAETYIRNFWGRQTDMADACLRKFQIIEVRVRLEPRAASAMSARMGQDNADWLEAKPASAVGEAETPNA